MPNVYIYSPVNAQVWALECYCKKTGCNLVPPCGPSGCVHTIVGGSEGFCCPIDLGGGLADGTVIPFRASNRVNSIKIEYINSVCGGGTPTPWTYGIKVHMYRYTNQVCYMYRYTNQVCYMYRYTNQVCYMYRYTNQVCYMYTVIYGHLKNRESYVANNQNINRPTGASWNMGLGQLPADCACGCSSGIHVHLSANIGTRASLACNNSVNTSSILYNFFWNDGFC
jgi:hypothetical protein